MTLSPRGTRAAALERAPRPVFAEEAAEAQTNVLEQDAEEQLPDP